MSFTVQPEKLHAYAEQIARQAGYVRQMNEHVGKYGATKQAHQQAENPPAALDQQVAEHFRSGQGGAELQTLQQAVDSGAASWHQLARGQGDPTLVGLFKSTINANFAICQQLSDAYRSGGSQDTIMRSGW